MMVLSASSLAKSPCSKQTQLIKLHQQLQVRATTLSFQYSIVCSPTETLGPFEEWDETLHALKEYLDPIFATIQEDHRKVTIYADGLGTKEVSTAEIPFYLSETDRFRDPVQISCENPKILIEISYTDDGDDLVFCEKTCWCGGSQCFNKKRDLYPEDYETEAEYEWRISEEERKYGWHR